MANMLDEITDNDLDINDDDESIIAKYSSSDDIEEDEDDMMLGGDNEFRIGIIGYSQDDTYDESEVDDELNSMIDEAIEMANLPASTQVVIVGNLLDRGVSKIAYDLAADRGFTSVGIFTEETLYETDIYPVDREHIIDNESLVAEFFVDYIDILFRVGSIDDENSAKMMRLAELNDIPTMEVDL